ISGSMSMSLLPEIGAALFRSPTSSSNSEANTEEGRWMVAACLSNKTDINSHHFSSTFFCSQHAAD
uniref:Uncharacterized protein n=1 Tax=Amphiprion ocellaris TaxID=80972 RepID=A0A3Q1B317_AMPOC